MLILALLAQIGPNPAGAPNSTPPEMTQRAKPGQPAPALVENLAGCLGEVDADPLVAIERATDWQASAKGRSKAEAGQCLGMALSAMQRWQPAQIAFLEARDSVPAGERAWRARLGAMAGNAALAAGNADAALTALDVATADSAEGADKTLNGEIALDRARAFVALGRAAEAEVPLAAALEAMPDSAQAWLLSATLSRRLGKLAAAQKQIEKAAELMPISPEIGLEAGVIAVLAGNDEAARKSWQSVVDAAPQSTAAATAKGYLAQLVQPAKGGK